MTSVTPLPFLHPKPDSTTKMDTILKRVQSSSEKLETKEESSTDSSTNVYRVLCLSTMTKTKKIVTESPRSDGRKMLKKKNSLIPE